MQIINTMPNPDAMIYTDTDYDETDGTIGDLRVS